MPYAIYLPSGRTALANTLLASLGIPRDPLGAHLWIVAGVASDIIPKLAGLIGYSVSSVCRLIGISQSTINRKVTMGSPLSIEQGSRVYGVVLALDAVLSLHEGYIVKSVLWLNRPAWELGGEKPVDMLTTPFGVQAVIDLAGQIEHGVY